MNPAEIVDTYAAIKERIATLEIEAGRLRDLLIQLNPTHGVIHQGTQKNAIVSWALAPDRIDRKALFQYVPRGHLITMNIVTPGPGYLKLNLKNREAS